MYVETDFLVALIKDDDWLGESAAATYEAHRDDLWTARITLIELLLVAYREDLKADRVVANAMELVEVRDGGDDVLAAATYVADHGLTPFDALHLVAADGDTIVSSAEDYDDFTDRRELRPDA